jgi:hypothetical protein
MTVATVIPASGAVLHDARDDGRWLRVSWHRDDRLFVFSIWRDDLCAASFQLRREDSPQLVDSLLRGLREPVAAD